MHFHWAFKTLYLYTVESYALDSSPEERETGTRERGNAIKKSIQECGNAKEKSGKKTSHPEKYACHAGFETTQVVLFTGTYTVL